MSKINITNNPIGQFLTAGKFLVLAFLLISLGCMQQTTNPDEIRDVYEAYNASFEKNDLNASLSFYTNDAVRLPSDGSMIAGIAAIRDVWAVFLEQNNYTLDEYSPAEIQVSGDLAVTYFTWDEHWTSKATGETTRQVGRSLLVWVRQSDGSWKISKEMGALRQE